MSEVVKKRIEARSRLKAQYGGLFKSLSALFFKHDPIGISFEDNTDEYEPEVATILPRLRDCDSALDVRRVVHEEMVRWFDESTAGAEEEYTLLAAEVWSLWRSSQSLKSE